MISHVEKLPRLKAHQLESNDSIRQKRYERICNDNNNDINTKRNNDKPASTIEVTTLI